MSHLDVARTKTLQFHACCHHHHTAFWATPSRDGQLNFSRASSGRKPPLHSTSNGFWYSPGFGFDFEAGFSSSELSEESSLLELSLAGALPLPEGTWMAAGLGSGVFLGTALLQRQTDKYLSSSRKLSFERQVLPRNHPYSVLESPLFPIHWISDFQDRAKN